MDIGLIILAGGKSSRMGTNKALLTFGGETTVERILHTFEAMFAQKILVTNDPESFKNLGVQIVGDNFPGLGPLAGIEAGLRSSSTDLNLITACDMPFAQKELAQHLISRSSGFDAIVPRINGKIHPLFAIYRKSILPVVEQELLNNRLRLVSLLDRVKVNYLGEDELLNDQESMERALFNMNHPHDYEEAIRLNNAKHFL